MRAFPCSIGEQGRDGDADRDHRRRTHRRHARRPLRWRRARGGGEQLPWPRHAGELVEELGPVARATTAEEAAAFGDVVVVSVPFGRYRELPTDRIRRQDRDRHTNNYDPRRDGHFEELDTGRSTSSELLQAHLTGSRVVKAFNAILARSLRDLGRPSGGSRSRWHPALG